MAELAYAAASRAAFLWVQLPPGLPEFCCSLTIQRRVGRTVRHLSAKQRLSQEANGFNSRKLPYWPGSLYKAHLEPAAKEIGIVGHFGWHTFRHTYATLLKRNGEDVKVVQELMRHANISVTLNVYAQAITQTKRDAQSRVVSLLLDKNEEKPSTEAYRTVTDLQNSGGDLQVVDKVGVPDGI